MTASIDLAWTRLDADPEHTQAELTRSFPHACIWLGEYTASWWALVRDRFGRSALLEGRTPAALYAELRAFHLREATAADGSRTFARPAVRPAARPVARPAARPAPTRPATTAFHRPSLAGPGPHRPPTTGSEPSRPPAADPEVRRSSIAGPEVRRPARPGGAPAASRRSPSTASHRPPLATPATGRSGLEPHRSRPLLLRVVSWLRGRRSAGRDVPAVRPRPRAGRA